MSKLSLDTRLIGSLENICIFVYDSTYKPLKSSASVRILDTSTPKSYYETQ